MRPVGLRTRLRRFVGDRAGVTAVHVAVSFPVLVGATVLAVDVAHLHREHRWLQISADSAALAAAHDLNGNPVAQAVAYADMNMPGGVLSTSDVITGNWNFDTRTFTAGGTPLNAVNVTTRRTQASGNPVSLYFANLVGVGQKDVVAAAIAVASSSGGGDCWDQGAQAGGKLTIGQDINMAKVCVYGQDSVSFGQDPVVGAEAAVATPDCPDFQGGDCPGFTTGQDPNIQGNVVGVDRGITQSDVQTCIQNFTNMLKNGATSPGVTCGDVWPAHITNVVYNTSASHLPSNPQAGTAYIFKEQVSINQDYNLRDTFVISEKSISWGQDGRIRNSAGNCDSGPSVTTIGILALEDISLGQDASVDGAALWAGGSMSIGQDLKSLGASLLSGGDMTIGQDPNFEGCNINFGGAAGTGGGTMTVRLVQ